MHIVSIFLKTDKSMIGLRFSGGPFFFPGLGNGVKMPICLSHGMFPSFAVVLNISAMLLCMEAGAYLMCSALISSMPVLLPFFIDIFYYLVEHFLVQAFSGIVW